jgi:hypothetical protein
MDVSGVFPVRMVIGSDQTMSLGDAGFTSRSDMNEAARPSDVACPAKTHQAEQRIAIAYNGDSSGSMSHAELTMRVLTTNLFDAASEAGWRKRALSSVGAYQLEGEGIAAVLENRWGLLHHSWAADAAAARKSSGNWGDRWMIHVKHLLTRPSSRASRSSIRARRSSMDTG